MVQKYSYTRFRMWNPVDLDKVVEEFSDFNPRRILQEKEHDGASVMRDQRNEVEVEADTLQAFLSSFRAVLNQKEEKPFTKRDMELRERVLEMYPYDRPTPFPWMFSSEPKFEKENP